MTKQDNYSDDDFDRSELFNIKEEDNRDSNNEDIRQIGFNSRVNATIKIHTPQPCSTKLLV